MTFYLLCLPNVFENKRIEVILFSFYCFAALDLINRFEKRPKTCFGGQDGYSCETSGLL